MEIKWFGTASIELKNETGKILFDPFVPLKGSNVKIQIEDFDGNDTIFVTHGHLDHIVNIPEIHKRNPNVKIYCTKTPYKALTKKGVPETNLIKISAGEEIIVHDFKIKTYQSKHAVLQRLTLKKSTHVFTQLEAKTCHFWLESLKNAKKMVKFYSTKLKAKEKQYLLWEA